MRVIVESPFRGANPQQELRNIAYARAALRDCLERDEAPFASHLLYTQPGVLDDGDEIERAWGIEAGLKWMETAHMVCVYSDLGVTDGMRKGIERAGRHKLPVETRTIDTWMWPMKSVGVKGVLLPEGFETPFDQIIHEVAREHGLSTKLLLSRRRQAFVAHARHEAMFRCYAETGKSLSEIGRLFGRDHTTILHGVRAHRKRLGER